MFKGNPSALASNGLKTTSDQTLEAVVGGGSGAEAGGVQGLPRATGAEDKQDGLHADAVGGGGLPPPKGCVFTRLEINRSRILGERVIGVRSVLTGTG